TSHELQILLQKNRHGVCERKRFFTCWRRLLLLGMEHFDNISVEPLQGALRQLFLHLNCRDCDAKHKQAGKIFQAMSHLLMASTLDYRLALLMESVQIIVCAWRHAITLAFIDLLNGYTLHR